MSPTMDDPESTIDEYLDAAAVVRTFRLTVYAGGGFLEAVERRDDTWTGLRFVLPVPAGEPPPGGERRTRIREGLAPRDSARHPRSDRLELPPRPPRGQSDPV